MAKIRVLESAAEVMAELGGPTAYGRLVGIAKQTANYYKNENRLPFASMLITQDALKKKRCEAAVGLFGLKVPECAA